MRILVATWHRQVVGGTEQYLATVVPALRAAGHDVATLVEHDATTDAQVVDDRPVLASIPLHGREGAVQRAREFRPDVCWIHGLEDPDLEARLLSIAPGVLFAHAYYGTCGTGTKRFAFPRVRPCERVLGPACLPLTYARRCGGLDPVAIANTWSVQRARSRLHPRYRRILVASRHMQRELLRHGVPEPRTAVVPLPLTGIAPLPSPVRRDPAGPVVFLGRLTAEKGPRHLVEAAAIAAGRGTRRTLWFIGGGPELDRLRRLASHRQVDAEFLGWRGPDRFGLLAKASLLAMPSLWPEPFGLSGIEAGALCIPAIGYEAGGIPEWLTPGVTGELAPIPPDPGALAAAMVRALEDPRHYDVLCVGAWEMAARHTMPAHLRVLESVFREARA
jgi:glycosyltransferase involved in cell wall biosynthesis